MFKPGQRVTFDGVVYRIVGRAPFAWEWELVHEADGSASYADSDELAPLSFACPKDATVNVGTFPFLSPGKGRV